MVYFMGGVETIFFLKIAFPEHTKPPVDISLTPWFSRRDGVVLEGRNLIDRRMRTGSICCSLTICLISEQMICLMFYF